MKRFSLIAAAYLFASPLCAQTYFFFGTIGKAPVFASLIRDRDNNLEGWYLYTRYSKQIELEGKIDKTGAFQLDEKSFQTTKKTGSLSGTAKQGVWGGVWQSVSGGAPISFSLTEYRNKLTSLNGDFKCSERHFDKENGYNYTSSAHLTFVRGAVTRMDLANTSENKTGDSMSCQMGLSDFKRVPSDDGIVLRAIADSPGRNLQHCSVRIVGNANFLYVIPGDLSEQGNDCRGAGDNEEAFCSARDGWREFLIDKSGVCKPNE